MGSLTDLNTYSETEFSFTDDRDPGPLFNLPAAFNLAFTASTETFTIDRQGIEVVEIIRPTDALLYLVINVGLSAGVVNLSPIPPGVTVVNTAPGIYYIGPILDIATWDLVKDPQITIPSGYNGNFTYIVAWAWFDRDSVVQTFSYSVGTYVPFANLETQTNLVASGRRIRLASTNYVVNTNLSAELTLAGMTGNEDILPFNFFASTKTVNNTAPQLVYAGSGETWTLNVTPSIAANVSDMSIQHIESNGNVKISTTHWRFGSSSAIFDGTGDFGLTSMDLTGDFTFECWIRADKTTGENYLFRIHNSDDAFQYVAGILNGVLYVFQGGTQSGSTGIPINIWHHVAYVRQGTETRLFLNGVSQFTRTNTISLANARVYIGGFSNNLGFDGFMDELRISNSARYWNNFTPSTTAFSVDANTIQLHSFEGVNNSTSFINDVTPVTVSFNDALKRITIVGLQANVNTALQNFYITPTALQNDFELEYYLTQDLIPSYLDIRTQDANCRDLDIIDQVKPASFHNGNVSVSLPNLPNILDVAYGGDLEYTYTLDFPAGSISTATSLGILRYADNIEFAPTDITNANISCSPDGELIVVQSLGGKPLIYEKSGQTNQITFLGEINVSWPTSASNFDSIFVASDDTIIFDNQDFDGDKGRVLVYKRSINTWTLSQNLTQGESSGDDFKCEGISTNGNVMVCTEDNSMSANDPPTHHVYTRPDSASLYSLEDSFDCGLRFGFPDDFVTSVSGDGSTIAIVGRNSSNQLELQFWRATSGNWTMADSIDVDAPGFFDDERNIQLNSDGSKLFFFQNSLSQIHWFIESAGSWSYSSGQYIQLENRNIYQTYNGSDRRPLYKFNAAENKLMAVYRNSSTGLNTVDYYEFENSAWTFKSSSGELLQDATSEIINTEVTAYYRIRNDIVYGYTYSNTPGTFNATTDDFVIQGTKAAVNADIATISITPSLVDPNSTINVNITGLTPDARTETVVWQIERNP